MKKKILPLLLSILTIGTLFTGCEEYELEPSSHDENLEMISEDIDETGNIKIPSLTQIVDIPGEDFKLQCIYDTGKYKLSDWRITDSKEVAMTVNTIDLPEGYTVFIDHVHADISLHGKTGRFNGIKQDEMDDSFHGYEQPGFYINNDTFYKNIFSIEGYTNEFISITGTYAYAYGFGYSSTTEQRITESELRSWGVNAEKLMVVYDLNIKSPEDNYYHTVSVSTEMLIPISQEKQYLTSHRTIDGIEYTIYYDANDINKENALFAYDKNGVKYKKPGVLYDEENNEIEPNVVDEKNTENTQTEENIQNIEVEQDEIEE